LTTGSIWVGSLALDGDDQVHGLNGPARADQPMARVLVRLHGAPLGFVTVPSTPAETLTARARAAAESALGDSVRCHIERDESVDRLANDAQWEARVACSRLFPRTRDTGMTIVICTRDRSTGLRECLRSVQQVSYSPLEILVVDNAPSGSQTEELVTALAGDDPRIRYACEPSAGLSRARNHGLAHARYDIVGFTDDDALVDPGWPAALAAGFASDPDAVCITGFVAAKALDTPSERYFDSRYPWSEVAEPRRYDMNSHRPPSRLFPFTAGLFGTGANFAVRRDAVLAVGGFDPLLGAGAAGRGGEDLDMFVRLVLAGGRICYLPSAFVWHCHRSDPAALGRQAYSYGHGLGAYLGRHLASPELRGGLVGHGLPLVARLAGRMRNATRESQMGIRGARLALTEAWGIAAGVLSYRRAARQAAKRG